MINKINHYAGGWSKIVFHRLDFKAPKILQKAEGRTLIIRAVSNDDLFHIELRVASFAIKIVVIEKDVATPIVKKITREYFM